MWELKGRSFPVPNELCDHYHSKADAREQPIPQAKKFLDALGSFYQDPANWKDQAFVNVLVKSEEVKQMIVVPVDIFRRMRAGEITEADGHVVSASGDFYHAIGYKGPPAQPSDPDGELPDGELKAE